MLEPKFAALHAGLMDRAVVRENNPPMAAAEMAPQQPLNTAHGQTVRQIPVSALTAPESVAKGKRRALTLRLDPVLHWRLRLTALQMDRSMQSIMVDALHEYMGEYGTDQTAPPAHY